MEDENNGAVDTLNQLEENEASETSYENDNDEQEQGESVEEYKARLAKAEELARNYKIRAEKAEKLAKSTNFTGDTATKKEGELSTPDVIFLAKTDIHDDDMEDVLKHAKLHKVSMKEAYSFLKPILDVRKEQRQTSQATHTRGSARGSSKISDETLLENAKRGKLPDNDADMLRLAGLKG